MDCLRSFIIGIDQNRTFATSGTNVKNWGPAGNYHWVIDQSGSSVYLIEGYRRIDLYGIEMIGNVQTSLGAGDGAIVQDFNFQIGINGQVPLVSGSVQTTPNFWAINQNQATFDLGKYTNQIMFDSPYQGCQSIGFNQFRAQGNNGETLNSINLEIRLQFKFYYKFDGE